MKKYERTQFFFIRYGHGHTEMEEHCWNPNKDQGSNQMCALDPDQ